MLYSRPWTVVEVKPLIKTTMSDYGSVESIKQKIREGVYRTFIKDHGKNEPRKYFEGISATENGEETKLLKRFCLLIAMHRSKPSQVIRTCSF